jgi:hypothetical protein
MSMLVSKRDIDNFDIGDGSIKIRKVKIKKYMMYSRKCETLVD